MNPNKLKVKNEMVLNGYSVPQLYKELFYISLFYYQVMIYTTVIKIINSQKPLVTLNFIVPILKKALKNPMWL